MRTRIGTILIAVVALAVGAAAGWFAAGARGKNKCENVEVCKYGNMKTANDGSAGNDEEALGNDNPCLVVGDIAHESAW